MEKSHPVGFTFHKVRELGEHGGADAWRAFLDFYSPLYLQLLALYGPVSASAPHLWEQTLGLLAENDFERFRATSRQSEREFLADVRSLLLDHTLATTSDIPGADEQATSELGTRIDLEKLGQLVKDVPLLHQEMLFFKLAGYTDVTLELVMRVTPRVAQTSLERLAPDYAAAQTLREDRCLWPAEWLRVLHAARAAKTDKCPPLHQFLRIQDGQVTWYDKEPVEHHVANCLHCLEAWTALREVGYWRRAAPSVASSSLEEFFRSVPLGPAPKKSLLQRVFG